MSPRRSSPSGFSPEELGVIRATLEGYERDRKETQEVMKSIALTLTQIQISMATMTGIQQETEKRLGKIEDRIGDDTTGLGARVTKLEGVQMLDESEVRDLDHRMKKTEDWQSSATYKIIGALAAAVIALAGFALKQMRIIT